MPHLSVTGNPRRVSSGPALRSRTGSVLVVLHLAALSVWSKSLVSGTDEAYVGGDRLWAPATRARLEQRLTPFFAERAEGAGAARDVVDLSRPSQADLFRIAAQWERLSVSFRELYRKATGIPEDFVYHVSPGGHFEVYYTTRSSSTSAVDTADRYGYESGDWRRRTDDSNGIPDYVDEVAWALDSAWSMEIERFGFPPPVSSDTTRGDPSRYKVVVTRQHPLDYGLTYPGDRLGEKGYSSYFEMRNEWSGSQWISSPYMDYTARPEDGVRVTCVHEYFHAIQYGMSRRVENVMNLDDFPIAWLEGTAVLMEEIAFDEINDYYQYARDYFARPRIPIFSDEPNEFYAWNGVSIYLNGLPVMYLYQRTGDGDSIAFVRNLFNDNHASSRPFVSLLNRASSSVGSTWPHLLGSFHAGSYFTGSRTRGEMFIRDAKLLPQWAVTADSIDNSYSLSKSVRPFGMNTFSLGYDPAHSSTMKVSFAGETAEDQGALWGVNLLLQTGNQGAGDTLLPVKISTGGVGEIEVQDWHLRRRAIVVASNADKSRSRTASVSFQPCPVEHRAGEKVRYVYVTPGAASETFDTAAVTLRSRSPLRCSMEIRSLGSVDNAPALKAFRQGLTFGGAVYEIVFPTIWIASSDSLRLTISTASDNVGLYPGAAGLATSSFTLYHLSSDSTWDTLSTSLETGARLRWTAPISEPGLYGVLAKTGSRETLLVYPNPARAGEEVHFECGGILETWVYRVSGRLVSHALLEDRRHDKGWSRGNKREDIVTWNMHNDRGRSIVPGTYITMVGYRDEETAGMKTLTRKLLVVP